MIKILEKHLDLLIVLLYLKMVVLLVVLLVPLPLFYLQCSVLLLYLVVLHSVLLSQQDLLSLLGLQDFVIVFALHLALLQQRYQCNPQLWPHLLKMVENQQHLLIFLCPLHLELVIELV